MRIATATAHPRRRRAAPARVSRAARTRGRGEIALSMRAHGPRSSRCAPTTCSPSSSPASSTPTSTPHSPSTDVWWAPDPASRDISTVGGNIATGAGGLLCAKYGVVRDAVLGVDLVLADGRLLHLGHRTRQGRDRPRPHVARDRLRGHAGRRRRCDAEAAPPRSRRRYARSRRPSPTCGPQREASAAVTASGVQPAIMELMDAASLAAVACAARARTADARRCPAHDPDRRPGRGRRGGRDRRGPPRDRRRRSPSRTTAKRASACSPIRRSMHPAMEALGTDAHRRRLRAAQRSAGDVRRDRPRRARARRRDPDRRARGRRQPAPELHLRRADEVPPITSGRPPTTCSARRSRLGGTLTGEHGIGVLKRRWLADELGDDQWELQRQITRVFDPLGILNPGKVFTP